MPERQSLVGLENAANGEGKAYQHRTDSNHVHGSFFPIRSPQEAPGQSNVKVKLPAELPDVRREKHAELMQPFRVRAQAAPFAVQDIHRVMKTCAPCIEDSEGLFEKTNIRNQRKRTLPEQAS